MTSVGDRHERISRRLAVLGGLTALVVCGLFLVWLPWLWWSGGMLEQTIPAQLVSSAGGHGHRVYLWEIVRHAYPGWTPRRGPSAYPESFLFHAPSDSDGIGSRLVLFEDGLPLGTARSDLRELRADGHGRYRHDGLMLFFSASDNTDPRDNGRVYSFKRYSRPRFEALPLATAVSVWLAMMYLWGDAAFRRFPRWAKSKSLPGLDALVTLGVLGCFSLFAFGIAQLTRALNLQVLALLAFAALFSLLIRRPKLRLESWMWWPAGLLAYGTFLTVFRGDAASWPVTRSLLLCGSLGLALYLAMRRGLSDEHARFLFLGLVAVFTGALVLQSMGFDVTSLVARLTGTESLPWIVATWTRKYRETWLLVLGWGGLALLPRSMGRREAVAAGCLVLLGAVVLSGYSRSVQSAFVLGVGVYLASRWAPRASLTLAAALFAGLLLFGPRWVGAGWDHEVERRARSELGEVSPQGLMRRLLIWEYARQLLESQSFLGRGLGAAERLPGRTEPAAELLEPDSRMKGAILELTPMPGGHPHSLIFLVWLELGVLGAVLVVGLVLTLFRSVSALADPLQRGAMLALLTGVLLVFFTNYPAWDASLQTLLYVTAGFVGSLPLERNGPTRESAG